MAKRLASGAESLERLETLPAGEVCRVCGGLIEIEPMPLLPESRYPRRRLCRICGNEYATTRPAQRNY